MKVPNVTICMAVYNAEKYIKEAIESVLKQTYTDFELLIINDGSTDTSLEIVGSFSDSRIRIIHNSENKGLLFTRNRGLQEALGTYIAIFDADDICAIDRIEKQVHFLENNPVIVICGTWGVTINEKSEVFGHKIMPEINTDLIPIEMLFRNQFIHSSVMYKKNIAIELEGYVSVNGCEDYGLFSKMAIHHKMANLPFFLIQYREHEGGISKVKSEEIGVGEMQILKFLYQRLDLDDTLLQIPFSVVRNNYLNLSSDSITNFFISILENNIQKQLFNIQNFNFIAFSHWYKIVNETKNKKALIQFYKYSKKYNFKLRSKQQKKLIQILINPFN
jgi:glycosyltransferase involved in cell wall biosynthesis